MNKHYAAQSRIDTPLGAMTLAATSQGLAGAWFDAQAHHPGELDAPLQPGQRWLKQAARELQDYFAGKRRDFSVPLDPQGTPFQQRVWRVLRGIPCGALHRYGDIARDRQPRRRTRRGRGRGAQPAVGDRALSPRGRP